MQYCIYRPWTDWFIDFVGLGKNMGNLILAKKNVFLLNKKFDSGLFFAWYCISMTSTNDANMWIWIFPWNPQNFRAKMISKRHNLCRINFSNGLIERSFRNHKKYHEKIVRSTVSELCPHQILTNKKFVTLFQLYLGYEGLTYRNAHIDGMVITKFLAVYY